MVGAPMLGGVSPAKVGSAGDNTYESSWNGTPFEEEVDPFARFDFLDVQDPDGDAFAEVPSPDVPTHALVNGSYENRTNSEIEEQMTKFGITQDEIAMQIDSVLVNSSYSDEEDTAIDQIYDGHYIQAHDALEGTPARVWLWCNGHAWDWYWGAPYPADCSGTPDPEVGLVATLTYVTFGNNNDNVESLEGIFEAQGVTLGSGKMGFGYRVPEPGISLGAREAYAENWKIDWAVDGLNSDIRDLNLKWSHNDLMTFGEGDRFHLGTFHSYNHFANYLDLHVGTATGSWELSGRFDHSPGKPGDPSWNGRLHVNLDAAAIEKASSLLTNGDTVVNMFSLPSVLTITWWRDPSRDTGGPRKHVELRTPTAERDFELRGRTEVEGSKPWKYSWVGLPEEVEIVVDTEDCCTPKVYSVDIREPQGSAGHIRSLNLKGDLEDKNFNVEMNISKVNRVRWVFGNYDWWMDGGEDNPFIRNGANFFGSKEAYSKLNLQKSSGTSLWDPFDDHHNRLTAKDLDTYKWEVSNAPDASPDEGILVYADNAGHNQYGWAIDEPELDKGCFIEYDSGDCP